MAHPFLPHSPAAQLLSCWLGWRFRKLRPWVGQVVCLVFLQYVCACWEKSTKPPETYAFWMHITLTRFWQTKAGFYICPKASVILSVYLPDHFWSWKACLIPCRTHRISFKQNLCTYTSPNRRALASSNVAASQAGSSWRWWLGSSWTWMHKCINIIISTHKYEYRHASQGIHARHYHVPNSILEYSSKICFVTGLKKQPGLALRRTHLQAFWRSWADFLSFINGCGVAPCSRIVKARIFVVAWKSVQFCVFTNLFTKYIVESHQAPASYWKCTVEMAREDQNDQIVGPRPQQRLPN